MVCVVKKYETGYIKCNKEQELKYLHLMILGTS
jgi:hypothetical protein